MALSRQQRALRSLIGNAVRYQRPGEAAELRRDLRASRLETEIEIAVSADPPLTADQTERLASLLLGLPVQEDSAA